MSDYPLSSPVAAGQATEAEQYNNLRRDALFLGADPSSSASIFDLLSSPQGASLVRSGTSEITVTAPLGLIIGGKICAIHSDKKVSVPEGLFLSPEKLCIYAVPDGTGSFAPEVSRLRVETAGTAYRLLGRFLWDGSAIIPGTLKNGDPEPDFPMLTQGRLTAVSGDPFPESDVSYAERIYFTPYGGNQVSLFCGGVWESFTFSEMSLQLSSLSQNTVYDVFLFADGSGLHLSAVPWGSLGPRPVGLLTWRDGVRVSSADPQKKIPWFFRAERLRIHSRHKKSPPDLECLEPFAPIVALGVGNGA